MDSMDLDTQVAEASATLEKIAQELDLDLNSLSTDVLEGALADIMGIKLASDEQPAETSETAPAQEAASAQGAPAKVASETADEAQAIRNVDVAMALSKYAANENIDLTKLSAEEYASMWDQMSEYLTSPRFEADKVAAAEMNTKLAEADVTGRQFAISFWDQLQKLAAEEEKGEDKGDSEAHERRESSEEEKEEEKKKEAALRETAKAVGAKAKELLAAGKATAKMQGNSLATRIGEAAGAGVKTQKTVGKNIAKAVGATAGVGAATTGAAYMAGKANKEASSEELDTLVTERARQILVGSGINPDSGEKFASDQELINFLAVEKLRALGIEVG